MNRCRWFSKIIRKW